VGGEAGMKEGVAGGWGAGYSYNVLGGPKDVREGGGGKCGRERKGEIGDRRREGEMRG